MFKAKIRQKRKLDHIEYALRQGRPETTSGFEDIRLLNDSLPGFSLGDVDPACVFMGKKLAAPLLINAITGGHPAATVINKSLARAARQTGVAMAVGSQTAGLEDPGLRHTYEVARQENPDGVLLANLSAGAPPEQAAAVVEMISADGLQLYLNVPQELAMREGDRDFHGVIDNIREVTSSLSVPVIVKEVGFGLSRETISAVYDAGVRHVDVGGQGGTNFIDIEDMRSGEESGKGVRNWGIPTAAGLLEGLSLELPVFIIASGGLETGLDVAKALALGAGMAGMAKIFLKELTDKSGEGLEKGLINKISGIINELRLVMLMSGAKNLERLAAKPVLVTGRVAEWMTRRGIDIDRYARR